MAKHKITKQELKEDKFVTGIIRAWYYSKDHVNFILGGIVIVVVIIAAIYGIFAYKNSRTANAEMVLAQGEQAQRLENFQLADSTYRFVVENFEGTVYSRKEKFLLAAVLFQNGRYDDAISTYEEYIQKPIEDDQDMIIAAKAGIAACQEEKKEFAEAADGYIEIVNDYPEYFDREKLMLAAGRCYQFSNQAQQAVETYRRFLKEYENSPLKDKAQVALTKIEVSVM